MDREDVKKGAQTFDGDEPTNAPGGAPESRQTQQTAARGNGVLVWWVGCLLAALLQTIVTTTSTRAQGTATPTLPPFVVTQVSDPDPTMTPSSTSRPSGILLTATFTRTPTATSVPTSTSTSLPTATVTDTPTSTGVPASNTPLPPTNTPRPPATLTFTPTSAALPTAPAAAFGGSADGRQAAGSNAGGPGPDAVQAPVAPISGVLPAEDVREDRLLPSLAPPIAPAEPTSVSGEIPSLSAPEEFPLLSAPEEMPFSSAVEEAPPAPVEEMAPPEDESEPMGSRGGDLGLLGVGLVGAWIGRRWPNPHRAG